MEKIDQILESLYDRVIEPVEAKEQLLYLFAVSKRHLLESILEDMDDKYPEYHREVVEDYLDDGC